MSKSRKRNSTSPIRSKLRKPAPVAVAAEPLHQWEKLTTEGHDFCRVCGAYQHNGNSAQEQCPGKAAPTLGAISCGLSHAISLARIVQTMASEGAPTEEAMGDVSLLAGLLHSQLEALGEDLGEMDFAAMIARRTAAGLEPVA